MSTGLTFEEILQRKNELVTKGISKSSKVKDCSDCQYAVACASRLIFEAQDSLNIDGPLVCLIKIFLSTTTHMTLLGTMMPERAMG